MTAQTRAMPKRALPFHPVLFATYPVLFLYAHNATQFGPAVMVAPLAMLISAAALLWAALGLLLSNTRKAAVIVSLSCLLVFFCRFLREGLIRLPWHLGIRAETVTLLVTGLLFLAAVIPTVRTNRHLRTLTRIINVIAIVLVLIPVCWICWATLTTPRRNLNIPTGAPAWDDTPLPEDTSSLPDIYYIICDAYARNDILREYYGYNNDAFLDWLTAQGFYVARKSHSNYNYTGTSLPTSLNMMHLVDLVKEMNAGCADVASMSAAMQHSTVTRFLKRRGYQTLAFSTGYAITDVTNADVFLSPLPRRDNEFIMGLIEMTPLGWVFEKQSLNHVSRTRILFTLDLLKSLPTSASPKFVYAHVMAPHRPFVFGPDGEHVNPTYLYPPAGPLWPGPVLRDDYRRFYIGQMTFLNSKLMEVIAAIRQRSTTPPIIILQADHGPASLMPDPQNPTPEGIRERMAILNAYHLPGDGAQRLYSTITPVNSFRVIFNHYFGTSLPLIEDKSFFDPVGDVTEMLQDWHVRKGEKR